MVGRIRVNAETNLAIVGPGGISGTLPVPHGGTGVTSGAFVHNGIWTPTDQSGAALTFSNVNTAYSQEGNMVFAYGRFNYPVTADGSTAKVSLPVAVPNHLYAQNGQYAILGTAAGVVVPIANQSYCEFADANGQVLKTNANLSGLLVFFLLIYPAA